MLQASREDRELTLTPGWLTGGGVGCWNASPTLMGCTIEGNSLQPAAMYPGEFGGGLACSGAGSSPSLTGCTISGNLANSCVDCADGSSPELRDSTIARNLSVAVQCSEGSAASLTDCTIVENGGGVYCLFASGLPPPDPGPLLCGPDGTDDLLDCQRYVPCEECEGSAECEGGFYCARADGDCNGPGTCRERPELCGRNWDPSAAAMARRNPILARPRALGSVSPSTVTVEPPTCAARMRTASTGPTAPGLTVTATVSGLAKSGRRPASTSGIPSVVATDAATRTIAMRRPPPSAFSTRDPASAADGSANEQTGVEFVLAAILEGPGCQDAMHGRRRFLAGRSLH